MPITRSQRCTATPTALANTSAGVWILAPRGVNYINTAVAGSTPPASDAEAAWRGVGQREFRISASESIYIWQESKTGLLFDGYADVIYQKISD